MKELIPIHYADWNTIMHDMSMSVNDDEAIKRIAKYLPNDVVYFIHHESANVVDTFITFFYKPKS